MTTGPDRLPVFESALLQQGPGTRIGYSCHWCNDLDALAEAAAFFEGLICPILDARRDQVYVAFTGEGRKG